MQGGKTQLLALNRILVPTNLGEPSRAALRYGVALAQKFAAKLYVVHVLSTQDYESAIETERVIEELLPEATPAGHDDGSPQTLARNAAREELAQLLSAEDARATQAEFIIRAAESGSAGDAIIDCLNEFDVELVVIGRHQHGFVEHLLARSVTRKVVRNAPCPVLIVHHPQHDFVLEDSSEV
jgi:nucleotide-binding universal stress UspA family protein